MVSVIIPYRANCPEAPARLDAALECLKNQSYRDFEVIVEPGEDGVSAARNRALAKAKGEFITFMDADDECDGRTLADLVETANRTGADFVLSPFWLRENEGAPYHPVLPRAGYKSIAEYLPRILGYSMDDVRRWNAGGALFDSRELAGVWRSLYRRDIIERFNIRFDESLKLYEDAIFTANYCLHAKTIAISPAPHYRYTLRPTGAVLSLAGSVEQKLALVAARRRVGMPDLWAASLVFAILELMRGFHFRAAFSLARAPDAAAALREFPLSWRRHPATALAVSLLRLLRRWVDWENALPARSRPRSGVECAR